MYHRGVRSCNQSNFEVGKEADEVLEKNGINQLVVVNTISDYGVDYATISLNVQRLVRCVSYIVT
jgi:hypothetical protein